MNATITSALAAALVLLTGLPHAWASGENEPELQPEAAEEAELAVRDGRIWWRAPSGESREIDLGCEARAALVHDGTGYVACAERGVVGLALTAAGPEVRWTRPVGGRAVGLMLSDGQVWVQIERREALPVASLARSAPQTAAPPPAPRPAPPRAPDSPPTSEDVRGTVIEQRSGIAILDLGLEHGLGKGNRIELFREVPVRLGPEQIATREDRIAVVQVVAASASRAQVRVGQNERVPAGAFARPTELPLTESRLGPPRLGALFVAEYTVRPFLALGTLGAGSISEAKLGYRFERDVTVEAIFEPLTVGRTADTGTFAGTLSIVPSYDTRYFQVGLGAGISRVPPRETGEWPPEAIEAGQALALAQVARLGSRDGLHLQVSNTFTLDRGEFRYGGTLGTAQTPLGSGHKKLWLFGRGGGGVAGYGFGELGLRILARGNGDRGSIYLTPSLGGALLVGREWVDCPTGEADACLSSRTYGGPMVGFGMEWRR